MINLNDVKPNKKPSLFEMLPMHEEFKEQFKLYIADGAFTLQQSKIVVSILARNVSKILEKNLNDLIRLLEEAKDYRIIIYENDSVDDTVEILNNFASKNEKIIVTTEKHNRKHYEAVKDLERTTNLSQYRNKNLSIIADNYRDFDYVIVLDIDFEEFYPTSLIHSLGVISTSGCNALCGFSYVIKTIKYQGNTYYKLWNYDSWAFRKNHWIDAESSLRTEHNTFSSLWYNYWIPPLGSDPIICNSGFGGMAIYKTLEYIQGVYDGSDCEHVSFHYSLNKKIPDFMLACNPSQVILFSEN